MNIKDGATSRLKIKSEDGKLYIELSKPYLKNLSLNDGEILYFSECSVTNEAGGSETESGRVWVIAGIGLLAASAVAVPVVVKKKNK